jgi:hypothetical protein
LIDIGSIVRVKTPFSELYPETYVVTGISETGAFQILDGLDFDIIFLEEVT